MPRVAASARSYGYKPKPKIKKRYAKQQKVRSTYLKRDNRAPSEVALNASRRAGSSDMGSMLGGMAGMALGGPTGAMIGNAIGGIGGNMISRLFGSGDYAVSNATKLKKNNLVLSNSAQAPEFGVGRVAVKFKHREYLGDVFSSSSANTFKIDSYAINPGQAATFPWLSGVIGAKFQQYRINGCVFEFRSMSADALNSTNTALGSVIMSTDYDSSTDTFASKQEMENTEFGVSCKPSTNMIHGIECLRAQTPVSELYIRAFDVPSGRDIRLYDLGRFSIASTGMQGTSVNLGELWVTYDIDAFKAIEQVPGYLIPYAQYQLNVASATAPLGTTQTVYPVPGGDDLIGLTLTENKISWPVDTEVGSRYQVTLAYQAAEVKAITSPAITVGNGIKIAIESYWKSPENAIAASTWVFTATVEYQGGATPGALPYLNFADYTWAVSSILQADLYVTQVSGLYGGTYTGTTAEPDSDRALQCVPEYVDTFEEEKKPVRVNRLRFM